MYSILVGDRTSSVIVYGESSAFEVIVPVANSAEMSSDSGGNGNEAFLWGAVLGSAAGTCQFCFGLVGLDYASLPAKRRHHVQSVDESVVTMVYEVCRVVCDAMSPTDSQSTQAAVRLSKGG